MEFAWINIILYLLTMVLTWWLYLISIQPMKQVAKRGEKGWKYAADLRKWSMVPMCLQVVFYILWFFYPITQVEWPIFQNHWISIIIGVVIGAGFLPFMIIGEKDAGQETLIPSKDTKMYGGIYRYIRHPQTLGEFPIYLTMGFITNSWFMVGISLLFLMIYTPIMIHFEEKDLIKRFGKDYIDYQKRTGALFPKLGWKKSTRAK